MALYKTDAEQSFCNTGVAQARACCRRIWGSPGRPEVQGLLRSPGQSSRIDRSLAGSKFGGTYLSAHAPDCVDFSSPETSGLKLRRRGSHAGLSSFASERLHRQKGTFVKTSR